MALVLKIMCWWEMKPCILVHRYQNFGGSCHLSREASSTLLLEAVFSVQTLVVITKLKVTSFKTACKRLVFRLAIALRSAVVTLL